MSLRTDTGRWRIAAAEAEELRNGRCSEEDRRTCLQIEHADTGSLVD